MFWWVVIGLVTCTLHSRFNKVSPPVSRFLVVLVLYPLSALAAIVVGAVMTVVWPHFQKLIFDWATRWMRRAIWGRCCTASSCVCSVHWVYTISLFAVLTTALGGSEIVNGQLVEGTQRIFLPNLPIRIRSAVLRGYRSLYVRALYHHDVWPAWRMSGNVPYCKAGE